MLFNFVTPHCVFYIIWKIEKNQKDLLDLPGGPVVKNLPANEGDAGSTPGLGRLHMPWGSWAPVSQLLSPRSRACKP